MQGHAVSNVIPVVASNRIGVEKTGRIFTAQASSPIIAAIWLQSFERGDEGVLVHSFDLDYLDRHRAAWGFFRDRRTEFYK